MHIMTMQIIFTPEEVAQLETETEIEMEEIGATWHWGYYLAQTAFAHAVIAMYEAGMMFGTITIGEFFFTVREGRIV